MIVNHHGGGLTGHVITVPRLSYKWRDMPCFRWPYVSALFYSRRYNIPLSINTVSIVVTKETLRELSGPTNTERNW